MTILGKDRWDIFELRSLMGIVSNDLLSRSSGEASGCDVVLSGFFSSARIFPHHVVDPRHRDLANAALAQLEISHLAQRAVSEMSSGEARRVLIARALVHKPRALLFDESSNSLDVFARHSLLQSMSALANAGIGIILVTHDLSDLIPEIERVLLMSNGRIIADGPKGQMLQPERLEVLFNTKVELDRRNGYYHMW
jgi:iron complex transport system ATP-binding protein